MKNKNGNRTRLGKAWGGVAKGAVTAALVTTLIPVSALAETTTVTTWSELYKDLGIDTSQGYDVVTSATSFTSPHADGIAKTVDKVTSGETTTGLDGVTVTGAEATVTPQLGSINYDYTPSRGDGEFVIQPDDTVEGYKWNAYYNSIYAVTVSDGTNVAGALPWVDWYGENADSGTYHYNKLEVALNNGESKGTNKADVQRFAAFYDENGNIKAGTYTVTVYANGYEPLSGSVEVLPTYSITATDVSKDDAGLVISGLPTDIQDAKATVTHRGSGRGAATTTLADGVDIATGGAVSLNNDALSQLSAGDTLTVKVSSSNYGTVQTTATVLDDGAVTSWKNLYDGLNADIDTSKGYDVVTSATNLTAYHKKDIATSVHKAAATDSDNALRPSLTGVVRKTATTTIMPKLGTATFDYNATRGDGEFVIQPDDTVEGYKWNDYYNSIYAVTVSDGSTTTGALPWVDWYGENATSGYHYNKLEVALNNGESKGSNKANVERFAAFYDENGNIKAGDYTVTVYADGYDNLTATVNVLPTYTGTASASDVSPKVATTTTSGLPENIKDAKVTVTYTVGSGRRAQTTTYASGAEIDSDGTVTLDANPTGDNAVALADLADGTELTVTVSSSNYAPIKMTAKVVVDRSALKTLIDSANSLRESRYTTSSWSSFRTAVTAATTAYEKTDTTQQEIDDAKSALDTAWSGLNRRRSSSGSSTTPTTSVDKSSLNSSINRSNSFNESDYTADSWKAFQDALKNAQDVTGNARSTQAQVDDATDALDKAISALVRNETPTPTPVPSAQTFPDVVSNSWYAPGVEFCSSRGIIVGYDDGRYGVGDPLTRAQLATILWRIAKPGAAVAYDASTANNTTGIADVASNAYYTAAANWAVENGVIAGYDNPDGTRSFGPDDPITPEQLATIVGRYAATDAVAEADVSALDSLTDGGSVSGWARQSAAWARSVGLILGYENPDGSRTLAPQENIARERVATIIMRAFELGILG